MKKIFLISSLFLIFSCSENFNEIVLEEELKPTTSQSAQLNEIKPSQDFVQGSQDIPLAANLEKNADEIIDFDSNSGSIISSNYLNKGSKQEIKKFYIKTLPELGWNIIKNLENKIVFKREKQQLEIEFKAENKQNIVTFFISSAL